MPSLPWLLVAVPHEHRAFGRQVLATLRRTPTAAWHCLLDGKEFLLAETGVGGAMAAETLAWLATFERPPFVFLAGFAGALADGFNVGDGVCADAVVDPHGRRHPATLSLDLPYRLGTLLTSDRLIGDLDDKRRLAATHRAVAVDMETSYVAAWCAERAIPWGCVRVVSDDVKTAVSKDVFDLLVDGRVSAWRLTKAIVRRPAIIGELLALRRATSRAADVIAAALRNVIGRREPAESRNRPPHLEHADDHCSSEG